MNIFYRVTYVGWTIKKNIHIDFLFFIMHVGLNEQKKKKLLMNLFYRTIYSILACCHRVYAGYHRLENLKVVVHNFDDWSCTVCSAGCSRNDTVSLGIVTSVIDPENEHWCIDWRRSDNNSFCATINMQLRKIPFLFLIQICRII